MILLFLVIILSAIAQVALAPISLFGAMPQIGLLLAAWLSYRYGAGVALPFLLIFGTILSFFVVTPWLVILAYGLAGVVIGLGATSERADGTPMLESIGIVAIASLFAVFITDINALGALSVVQMLTYILLTAFYTICVWWIMLIVADPRQ